MRPTSTGRFAAETGAARRRRSWRSPLDRKTTKSLAALRRRWECRRRPPTARGRRRYRLGRLRRRAVGGPAGEGGRRAGDPGGLDGQRGHWPAPVTIISGIAASEAARMSTRYAEAKMLVVLPLVLSRMYCESLATIWIGRYVRG